MNEHDRNWAISQAVFLILIVFGAFYLSSQVKEIRNNQKIVAQEMKTILLNLESSISNLSSEFAIASTDLDNFKKHSQQEIKTLSSLVDQIEQQSNLKLSQIKEELKTIQVKSADFSSVIEDVLDSTVSITTNKAQGSGVAIRTDGYIITNVHVIKDATKIRVSFNNGNSYSSGIIVGMDESADIAVLKIDAKVDAIPFGDSSKLKVGEKVIAAGNPAGLSFTVTEGIVSATRKFNGITYIQTDVPMNPGNSGGPLISVKGEIVGINNWKVGGYEGLGFALSSNDAKDVANDIIDAYEDKLEAQAS